MSKNIFLRATACEHTSPEIVPAYNIMSKHLPTPCTVHVNRLLDNSDDMLVGFRALARRVRDCQEKLEQQELALEDVS